MHKVELLFTDDEARKLLESVGLTVKFQKMPFVFPSYHDQTIDEEIEVWVVINPYTSKPELLSSFFRRYLETKKNNLFLTVDNKLDIYNLFNKDK